MAVWNRKPVIGGSVLPPTPEQVIATGLLDLNVVDGVYTFGVDPNRVLNVSSTYQNRSVFAEATDASFQSRGGYIPADPSTHVGHVVAGWIDSVIVSGSGTNGPGSADMGRVISAIKKNFSVPAAAHSGEIDVLLIAGRQGGPTPLVEGDASDMDGIQLNIAHVGDPGFMAGVEMVVSRIDPTTFLNTHTIGIQIGTLDPFGKNGEQGLGRYAAVNRALHGFIASANTGTSTRAFMAQSSSTGAWEDYLYLRGSTGVPFLSMPRTVNGLNDLGAIRVGPRPYGGTIKSWTLANDGNGNCICYAANESSIMWESIPNGDFSIGGHYHGGNFYSFGTKVVGAQGAAITDDASGAANQAKLNAVLAAMRTHGLIAP